MRLASIVPASLLLLAVACGGGDLAPGAGDDPGTGSLTLEVDADISARPLVTNAKTATDFTTEFHVRIQKGGTDVTTGTVFVTSSAGQVPLTYAADNRWTGAQPGYFEVYELSATMGADYVDGIRVDGPALHYFTAPLPGATVDSTMPLPVTWKRGEEAETASLDTDKIDQLTITDSGTYSLPAGSLKSKSDAVEQDRIRIERSSAVVPTGAVAGSQMRVHVRNDVELLVMINPNA